MTRRRLRELAEEATTCIETCGLRGDEMEDYLKGFLGDVLKEAGTTKPTKRRR